ncbi:uncharacterized protein HKW66_Vig0146720 [Vigna angularis]|uniref:Neprosin PEP catalytic domain-containing protein n=1 Tax=Phaseolus angularis TaxID=3914 RepID=A0A8T0KDW9_PHAAN|nr:uncharacterized protein HKW66_Vig0146720 [Vigna angularis]
MASAAVRDARISSASVFPARVSNGDWGWELGVLDLAFGFAFSFWVLDWLLFLRIFYLVFGGEGSHLYGEATGDMVMSLYGEATGGMFMSLYGETTCSMFMSMYGEATGGMFMSMYGEATSGMFMSRYVYESVCGSYKRYVYEPVWGSYKWVNEDTDDGIVHTNSEIYLGQHVGATSSYGGPIFDFDNYISMHAVTKDWWIQANGEDIGYYPAKLFSNLTSADKVGWGGRTLTPHGSHSPPMGAGHFPDNDLYHSSYFRTISFENAIRIKNGPEIYQTEKYVDKPNCFGLKYYGNLHGIAGYMVQFGGPGGMCDD